jgi:hypothetical protein
LHKAASAYSYWWLQTFNTVGKVNTSIQYIIEAFTVTKLNKMFFWLLNGEQANFSSTITVMVIQFPDDDYGDGP